MKKKEFKNLITSIKQARKIHKTKNGICDTCVQECKGDGEPFDTEVLKCEWYEVRK